MLPVIAAMMGALAAFVFVRSKERYYQYKADLWEGRCASVERELTTMAKRERIVTEFLGYSAAMWVELRDLLKVYTPGRETPLQTARGIIDEWNENKRILRERMASLWSCGCGHVNGANLPTCAACTRPPGGWPEEQRR